MIHIMPFTYFSEPLLNTLTGVLGPLALCQSTDTLVPDYMRTASSKGMLQLRYPAGLDQDLLQRTLKAYTDWADLHKGKSGDLTAFIFSDQAAPEWLRESAGNIRDQIRKAGRAEPAAESPLFQAALFLGVAHLYDRQRETLDRELGAFLSLERRFGDILGEPEEARQPIGPALSADPLMPDPGAYLTERRVASWARAAAALSVSDSVYITPSPAVWEFLLERLPDAAPLIERHVEPGPETSRDLAQYLDAVPQAEDPHSVSVPASSGRADRPTALRIECRVLAGRSPGRILSRLANGPSGSASSEEPRSNTIIGYIGKVQDQPSH